MHFRNQSIRTSWAPETRLLDKDERLPEVDPGYKINFTAQHLGPGIWFRQTVSPDKFWPPMDPLRPTAEQKRISNSGNTGWFMSSHYIPPYKLGFRTIPPELVDWRTTMYGNMLEEFPYVNEKTYFSTPDYYNAGMIHTANECKAQMDASARTIEDSNVGPFVSPKVDAWYKFENNAGWRNWRSSASTMWSYSMTWLLGGYLFGKYENRTRECAYRKNRSWWDGAYASTWKYASWRQYGLFRGLSGGNMFYIF